MDLHFLLQRKNEGGLDPRRDNQEWEHDGEISPEGMLYVESEKHAFLAPYSPDDRHSET